MPAETWSGASLWQDSYAPDLPAETYALASSINKSLMPHFASRAARNAAVASIDEAERTGLMCTVAGYGLCIHDGNERPGSAGWSWACAPVLLHDGVGIGATSSTTPNNISTFSFTAVTKRKLLIITESRCQQDVPGEMQARVFLTGNEIDDNRQEVYIEGAGVTAEMHVSRSWMLEAGPGDLTYTYKALRVQGSNPSIFTARGTVQIWDLGPTG